MEQYNGQGNGDNGLVPLEGSWIRVVDLASELNVDARAMRRWISRNVSQNAQRRLLRPDGGHPELWVSPAGVVVIRQHYEGTDNGTDGQRVAVESADHQRVKGTDTLSDDTEGWKAAVTAAEARANELRQDLDRLRTDTASEIERLRRELGLERQGREQAQRQAEEAERARAAYAERLAEERAAWWQWCAYLKGLSVFKRLRRLPEPPEELTKGTKRLSPPQG